ncbi:hypothetical protein [Hwangdonia lutea]|uniref:Uncharacterized protein n=1 Tax=Hwangdonia lutea TaxID=3075823 RepID=A0AA97HQN1_9FLAO|nr:hypothetical protein [Hwangdonia sp. SCSIO 19198]WOD42558.1 hypothetical protein RNZ46_11220 [Hwangdonia sp. SCSIO 19198]
MPKQKDNPKNKQNSSKGKNRDDEPWIDSDRVMNKAQSIVNSAVNVLEEEIAAGILAAKKIEKKLIDVDEIRSDPDALMNRIRRDSHEVLDLVIDGFAAITAQMNEVVESLKNEKESQSKKNTTSKTPSKKSSRDVIVLEPENPMKSGESVSLNLIMYEDTAEKPKTIEFRKSDFIGSGNQKIGLRSIIIQPKKLQLKPKEEKDISITIKLPKNTVPGDYNAFITCVNNPQVRILIALKVIE